MQVGSCTTHEQHLRHQGYDLQKHSQRSSPQLIPVIGLAEVKLVPLLGIDRQVALCPEVEWDVHYH